MILMIFNLDFIEDLGLPGESQFSGIFFQSKALKPRILAEIS